MIQIKVIFKEMYRISLYISIKMQLGKIIDRAKNMFFFVLVYMNFVANYLINIFIQKYSVNIEVYNSCALKCWFKMSLYYQNNFLQFDQRNIFIDDNITFLINDQLLVVKIVGFLIYFDATLKI